MRPVSRLLLAAAICGVGIASTGCSLLRIPASLARAATTSKPKKPKAKPEEEKHGLAALGGGSENSTLSPLQGGAPSQYQDPNAKTTADGAFDFSSMTPGQGFTPKLTQWKQSLTEVMRDARKQGKLVMVFATHNAVDAANQMESTLLSTPNFVRMVGTSFLLLRVDYGDSDTKRSQTYTDLKSRLNIRGFPNLSILQPDGKVLLRLSGYTSDSKGRYLQTIKDTIEHAPQILEKRRKDLESSGYRYWRDKSGAPVFAKLKVVDANMLTLTTEWGEEFKTFANRLSPEDQAWIEARRNQRAAALQ